jgi:protocatechuate 3,4-dioxygenase, beta subunit
MNIALPLPFSRRRLVLAAAATLAAPAVWRSAAAQGTQVPTPAQAEGPFYPVALPADSDADLLANGALRYGRGRPAWLEGRVTDTAGRALAGGQIEIWQCDEDGHYHHPGDGGRADPAFQGFGRATLAQDGSYRFRTLRPAPYGGRTPHIHVKVKLGTRTLLTTQLYVEGDAGNERDFLWRGLRPEARRLITVPFVAEGAELRARFPIAVTA